jgi:hypothetical protein
MNANAKPSLLQRVIDAWSSHADDADLDAAGLGTAFGLDCCDAELDQGVRRLAAEQPSDWTPPY